MDYNFFNESSGVKSEPMFGFQPRAEEGFASNKYGNTPATTDEKDSNDLSAFLLPLLVPSDVTSSTESRKRQRPGSPSSALADPFDESLDFDALFDSPDMELIEKLAPAKTKPRYEDNNSSLGKQPPQQYFCPQPQQLQQQQQAPHHFYYPQNYMMQQQHYHMQMPEQQQQQVVQQPCLRHLWRVDAG